MTYSRLSSMLTALLGLIAVSVSSPAMTAPRFPEPAAARDVLPAEDAGLIADRADAPMRLRCR